MNTQQEITAVNIRTITGSNIKRLREAHDYTQSQLASRLGTQPQNVSALETGALGLSDNKLAKLCNVFGVGSEEFFRLCPPDAEMDLITKLICDAIHAMDQPQKARLYAAACDILEKKR